MLTFSKTYKRTKRTKSLFPFSTFRKTYKYLSKEILILYVCTLVRFVRFCNSTCFAAIALVRFVRFLYVLKKFSKSILAAIGVKI